MASSSNSSIQKRYRYDVFLSFSGEDTRKTFVDHLYAALERQGIHTYKDDEKVEKGKRINDELIKSIEDSKFFIIVFSKKYASSSWCLDELVKIMEFQKTTDQIAHPVFYDVEPSEVRKVSGAVGEAFAKHHKEEVGKWREALEEAGNLAGWVLSNTADGHEAKFIKRIVEEISLDLCSTHSSADEKLIGMETRIMDILSSLELGVDDVRMVGIKGIGGGGKTTLARAVFDHICLQFEGVSFVENVREVSKATSGLNSLQKQVLSDLLHDHDIGVSSVSGGKNLMKRKLCGKKVLVVLDDVDHIDQIEALAGAPNWFKPGSRIIITTRDEQVLVAHGVKWIHNVNLLLHEEALCLFSRFAFGREVPIEGYEKLSVKVVHYAAGLPLTIRILGSFLCGKDKLEWIDALERLKTIPLKETLEKLELSYIGLEDDYKEIFLDIACHLKGTPKKYAIRMLESCGFHARNGLRVLEQKSLITMSKRDEYLGVHDHLEEMGWNIVRRLHPDEPHKHSRLWIHEEIEEILANDLGTEATRCIQAWRPLKISPEIAVKGFGNMKKLRFLSMVSSAILFDLKIDQVSQTFPNALRFLSWEGYPLRSLPKLFQAYNLVTLSMPYSRMEQLWEGGERKVLNKLRFLNLSRSQLRTLDLGLTPNLESLDLNGCHKLVEVDAPVGCLKRLDYLDLRSCSRFKFFLFMKPLESLECFPLTELHLSVKFYEGSSWFFDTLLRKLWLTFNYKGLPSSAENHEKLVFLDGVCTKFESFSESICGFQQLRKLRINGPILEVPEDLGQLQCLEELHLSSTDIIHLPDSLCMLKNLKYLELVSCSFLEKLPEDLGQLECLEALILTFCRSLRNVPNSICKMKHLRYLLLPYCSMLDKLPTEIGCLESLEELNIEGTHIRYLPLNISSLKGLRIVGSQLRSFILT